MTLLDISFSDLFIRSQLASSSYKTTPDCCVLSPLPAHEVAEFSALRTALLDKWQGSPNDFRLEWGNAPHPVLLRVKPIKTAYIPPLFVCRRSAPRPGSMLELGFPPEIVKRPPRLLQVSPLLVLPESHTVIRSNIRSGAFQQLNSEIEVQKNMFLIGGLP